MNQKSEPVKTNRGRRQFLGAMSTAAITAASSHLFPQANVAGMIELEPQFTDFLIGTYTGGRSRGVYRLRLNLATGQLSQLGLEFETSQPSFLALANKSSGRFLAVGETNAESENGGTLTLFESDSKSGRQLDQKSTLGAHPCHLVVDPNGDRVVVANYSGGSYTVFQLQDDRLSEGTCYQNQGSGPNKQRQEGPHGHCVRFIPGNSSRILAADLGTDQILLFEIKEEDGKSQLQLVSQLNMEPGAGPRQIDFHPSGKWFYVINELDSTMSQVQMPGERGEMKVLQTLSTLPEGFKGRNSTAHLQVHPNGKFLYGSNRGDDSLAIFAIDDQTGSLTLSGHKSTLGKTPRHFVVEPSGNFLLAANQDSDNVVVFPINKETGLLGDSYFQAFAPKPVCVLPVV